MDQRGIVLGVFCLLLACGRSSQVARSETVGSASRQRNDSLQAVARACYLVRSFVVRDPGGQCRVERFESRPEEYLIRVRIDFQAGTVTQAAEVRLAKEEREATVRMVPSL
jgi:hypothetical protein